MSTYYLSVDPDGNVIMHHGVKGMKWGQHIFGDKRVGSVNKRKKQRISGETAGKIAGAAIGVGAAYGAYATISDRHKARKSRSDDLDAHVKNMSNDELNASIKRQSLEKTYKKGLSSTEKSDRLDDTKKLVDATNEGVKAIKRISEQSTTKPIKPRMDLSKMSDKELRDRINRENLELQYNRMFNDDSTEVSRGKRFADAALNTTSNVLTVTASALLIAKTIKDLRG